MKEGILPGGWTVDEVRQRAADRTVELLDSSTPVVLQPNEPDQAVCSEVDVIIGFTGLCLARCVEDGEWSMGRRSRPGEPLFCW
ncbi:hypothetical protein [Nocardia cerradoensis]|uniref:hypothetical protein n=1 Tax=Nocardia cerradoensis TaxID=85688 RepID=UPI0002D70F87|nr:hypothetical protein [Nocardia cerradoensis]NKY42554.1 hypothetical protein [Nocardia cerradoensis]